MTKDKDKRMGVVIPNKGQQQRGVEGLDVDQLVVEGSTIKGVAIATDQPVMREFGEERLNIKDGSIRFLNDTIPLLLNHNPNDRRLGEVSNMVILDGVVRADLTFDTNYDVARDLFKAITVDKQRQDLSIGYICEETIMKRIGETLAESHLVTDCVIYDLSIVGRGADSASGFYRSAIDSNSGNNTVIESISSETMPDKIKDNADAKEVKTSERSAPAPKQVDTDQLKRNERSAIVDLFTLAENHGIDMNTAKGWVKEGISLNDAKDRVLDAVQKRGAKQEPVRFADNAPKEDEVKYKEGNVELSLRGAIDALVAAQLGNAKVSKEAGLAREVSQELGGGTGLKLRVPYEALSTRAFEATASKQGGNVVQDTVRMDLFSKFLYNNTVSGKLGMKNLTGLVDDVNIPRQTKSVAASYVSEGGTATAADMETSAVKLTPHSAIALTKVTNLAKAQIPGIQSMLQDDLLTQLKIAIDRTTLIGGGTNEPTGIMATSGVNTARTGNTGTKTRKFDLDEIITVLGEIQDANVTGQAKIVAPPSLINYWRKQKDSDGQYLWSANTDMSTVMDVPGFLFGLPVLSSTNLRNAGDAATDFRLLIGVFEYAVMAFWGNSLNVEIGTTGSDFASDTASIRAVAYHDAAAIRTAAFKSFTKIEV